MELFKAVNCRGGGLIIFPPSGCPIYPDLTYTGPLCLKTRRRRRASQSHSFQRVSLNRRLVLDLITWIAFALLDTQRHLLLLVSHLSAVVNHRVTSEFTIGCVRSPRVTHEM
jgi:hypothetical protein